MSSDVTGTAETETKYGGQITPEWRWSCEHGVNVTRHARDRWDDRTPADSVSLEHAWEHGRRIPETFYAVFSDKRQQDPDEVRTWREGEDVCSRSYQVCLVVRNDHIVTVLASTQLSLPERAYLRELWFCRGGSQ